MTTTHSAIFDGCTVTGCSDLQRQLIDAWWRIVWAEGEATKYSKGNLVSTTYNAKFDGFDLIVHIFTRDQCNYQQVLIEAIKKTTKFRAHAYVDLVAKVATVEIKTNKL